MGVAKSRLPVSRRAGLRRGWRYVLATGLVLAAFALRQGLTVRFGPGLPAYITLYPSVMTVAYLLGFGPGVWATAVAVLLADYWILPPVGSLHISSPMDLLGLMLFIGMSLATSVAAGLYHRYRSKATAYDRAEALAPVLTELKEAQRLTHIGSWYWDAASDVTRGSEELDRLFGFDPANPQPLTFQAKKGTVYPDEDWERVRTAMQRTLATGIGYEIDLRVLRGPSHIWVTARGEAVRAADGLIIGLRGTVQDITERKRAEETVRASEEGFRTLANAIPHLCWMANADGWIFWYNQRWYDYTGTTPEQMEGWGWQSVHDPAVLPSVLRQWQASIDGGLPFEMVFPLRGRDGRFRPFLTRVMPVRDAAGKVTRWFGTNTDITEREQAAEALRQSQEWLRVTLVSIGDAVIACDVEGRVTFMNPVAEQMTGWSAQAAIGLPMDQVFRIVSEETGQPAQNPVVRVLREGIVLGLANHTALVHTSGRVTPIQDSAAPIRDSAGKVVGVVLVFSDMSEARRTEAEQARVREQMVHLQKLESLGVLVAGVAHNFNNLLTVILGYATLREAETRDADDGTAYQAIIRAAERGKGLVDAMVHFGRPTLASKAPLDVIEVAREVRYLLKNATANRIAVVEDYPEAPAWVLGDNGSLSSVVMNICLNSLDAMPEGGTLTLQVNCPEAGWTELAVSDTGMGMNPEVLARATEPFFTTKPVGAGTGLGLSSALGVVRAHGGMLDLRSVPERGTTVRIRLPRLDMPQPAAAPAAPAATLAGRLRHVLLVDDDPEVREVMGRMLTRGGVARVETAGGGAEALARLAAGALPDLVILDLNMPGLNGAQTLERIRASWPHLRVLIASGQPDIERWPEFRRQGTATIMKPFTLDGILAKLARL